MVFLLVKHLGMFFFTIILSVWLYAPFAYACMPAPPDDWFTTALSFDTTNLPPGVMIVPAESNPKVYAIHNTSSEPFYIAKMDPTSWQEFPASELPDNLEPLYKLVNNKSYYYINTENGGKAEVGYMLNGGGVNNSAERQLSLTENVVRREGEDKNISQDNRPNEVAIPQPQSVHILGYYQASVREISGTLTYSLNEQYDANKGERGGRACARLYDQFDHPLFRALTMIFTIAFIVVGVFTLVFILHKMYRLISKK